jgi:hypothetical protein
MIGKNLMTPSVSLDKELSQEIAFDKRTEAEAARKEQPQPPTRPPAPKTAPRPIPTKPQTQESSKIAAPAKKTLSTVNTFEEMLKPSTGKNWGPDYNHAAFTMARIVGKGKVTEDKIPVIMADLENNLPTLGKNKNPDSYNKLP